MRYIIFLIIVLFSISCGTKHNNKTGSSELCIQSFAQTFSMPNGNRCTESTGLLNSKALEIPLGGQPVWITGITINKQLLWAVTLENGTVELIKTERRTVISHKKQWNKIHPGTPPVLGINCKGKPVLVNGLTKDVALFAAPLPIAGNKLAYISNTGDLVISSEHDTVSLSIHAMHDSRIITDKDNRLLVLTHPVQYYHGVLGNNTEARGIAIIETTPQIKVQKQFMAPDSSVIEGVGVIWEDLNGDGTLEIAVTLSNNTEGTGGKHAIFSEDGKILASGKNVKPDGWRHLLLAFKLPQSHNSLLAAIQRPHVDRLLNLYEWKGDSLKVVAQLHGFSTHMAGSRNLDGVLCTDINNDGYQDILLPCTTHDTLYGVSYNRTTLQRIWNSPLDGISVTNIARAGRPGHAAIALGTDKNVMKIWFSE